MSGVSFGQEPAGFLGMYSMSMNHLLRQGPPARNKSSGAMIGSPSMETGIYDIAPSSHRQPQASDSYPKLQNRQHQQRHYRPSGLDGFPFAEENTMNSFPISGYSLHDNSAYQQNRYHGNEYQTSKYTLPSYGHQSTNYPAAQGDYELQFEYEYEPRYDRPCKFRFKYVR